ncbi:MAG: hypothetical protein EZS28_026223 [Streblomastix strix]|uniref:Inositol polyphosphate-related phosphatase domain-containing protein n=1 Tax=Streblomastix strix TaxID=222440 RepID=A0A5J4V7B9_9EUKA|nr:MAG: hypothetical protein EZS28_026223 [Streblomastix strix]
MMRESFFDKLSQSCIPANKHDYCFLMGDLNLSIWMEMQRKDIERGLLFDKLERQLSFDELNMESYQRRSFDEFEEMRITWGPTYRFIVGSHVFDMRLPEQILTLQGGTKFEVMSKLFVDIQKTWEGYLNNTADLKELIPEFYTPPGSFLLFNSQDLDLSSVQDGFTIGDSDEYIENNDIVI